MARNDPGPPNAASITDQRALEKGAKRRRRLELEDLRAVLGTGPGRRTVWRFLARFGAFKSVFHPDAAVMAYQAGQQDDGHWLLAELAEVDPAAVYRLAEEADGRERKEREVDDALRMEFNGSEPGEPGPPGPSEGFVR
jgi:hypothetical protein